MTRKLLKDGLGWGVGLWLLGYILGIMLFPILPNQILGWVIMPVGVLITLWVLLKKIKADSFNYYLYLAIIWTFLAIILDYFLLVKLFKPADGYYKLDVYLYYLLTFLMPLFIGFKKSRLLNRKTDTLF